MSEKESTSKDETHFGYQTVSPSKKTEKVKTVFDGVSDSYDLMNDLMSFGLHRLWKRRTILLANIQPHHRILDLASGTGDLAISMAKKISGGGQIILSDINASMLIKAQNRLIDLGIINNVSCILANAEELPFPDSYFDRITMSFGLRNVTHKERALNSICRVLKPSGTCLITEFSHPNNLLKPFYDKYSFSVLPKLGKWVAKNEQSYRYLAESIRMHPDQETLKQMMLESGFENCDYYNLSGGIVAIHRGYKC